MILLKGKQNVDGDESQRPNSMSSINYKFQCTLSTLEQTISYDRDPKNHITIF